MPSIQPSWRLPLAVLALVVLAYALVIAGNVLIGVFLVAALYLVAWLIHRLSSGNPLDDVTRARAWAAGVVVLAVLAYSVVIATSLLLGILVAATVCLVSWVTSPIGPVARWLS